MSFPLTPIDGQKTVQNNIIYAYSLATNSWRRDFNNTLDRLFISGTYTSVSTTTGAVIVLGGVGVGGDLYARNIYDNGNRVLTTASIISGSFGVSAIIAGTGTHVNTSTGVVTIWSDGTGGGGGGSTSTSTTMTLQDVTDNGASTNHVVSFINTTTSASTITGAVLVVGGVGIGGNVYVGGTGNFSANGVTIGSSLVSSYASNVITTNFAQNLDTMSTSTYRTARYVFQVIDGAKIHVSEMTVFHDYTFVYLNEYGIATSAGPLGTFDAAILSGDITLTFRPNYVPTAMFIKGYRTAITA